ncbi:putative glycosidase CRH2 [Entomophthora muscae]|uniref:Glycosidase CRH2 n=1 Tax=Entomophthora muscae TaxID=34485 RepID=A0ACC2T8N5_9FUNG|nr:putative glycosidase CRH2 [Entomophthora muscae]
MQLSTIAVVTSCLASCMAGPANFTLRRREEDGCMPWKEDFRNGMGMFIGEGQVGVDNNQMVMKISLGNTPNPTTGVIMGYGAKVTSKNTILYGTTVARIKSSRVGGVVNAFVIMSPQKDEIDWEWVGKDESSSQTNFYVKGIIDYTKGQYIPNSFNTHEGFHDYGINWTPESITWTIDGAPVRTITRSANGGSFPDTPSNIYFSLWDGGSNAVGTRDWAGGLINWQDPEILRNGYMSAVVESVTYTC